MPAIGTVRSCRPAWSRPDIAAPRGLCWHCARLSIRDVLVAGVRRVTYTCGLNIRAPEVARCAWFLREPGADDHAPPAMLARRLRWPLVGTVA